MDSTPEPGDLTRDVYRASEGRNPAGTLALVAAQFRLLAAQAGVAAPDGDGFRPEAPADRVPSGRAITADTRHLHAVAQDSPNNPERAAERDAAVAGGDTAALHRWHDEGVTASATILTDAARSGFRFSFDMSRAARFTRVDG